MPVDGVKIPVPLQTRDERRRAERFIASMPVTVDGHEGTTQDLSTTGLSFHADRAYELGSRVQVVIEYLLDGHKYPLHCEAEVVRSEASGEGFTIGARLTPQAKLEEVSVTGEDTAAALRQHLRSID